MFGFSRLPLFFVIMRFLIHVDLLHYYLRSSAVSLFHIFVDKFILRTELPVCLPLMIVCLIISCLNVKPHTSSAVGHGHSLTGVSVTFRISSFNAQRQTVLCVSKLLFAV